MKISKRCLMVAAGGMLNESGYSIRVWLALRAIREVQGDDYPKPALVTFESPRSLLNAKARARLAERASKAGVELFVKSLVPKKLPRSDLFNRWLARWAVRKLVKRREFGVVHGQSHAGTDYAHGVNLIRNNTQTVFDVHGVDIEERLGDGRLLDGTSRHKLAREVESKLWRDSKYRIVVSNALGQFLNSRNGLTAAFSVVPCLNSLSSGTESLEEMRRDAREKLNYAPDNKVLLYLGGASSWQQPQLVVDVFHALYRSDSSWRLLILTADTSFFHQLTDAAELPAKVVTVTTVDHALVPKYGSAADLGVLLRADNAINSVASPTKFGEYLHMGVPVLLTSALSDFANIVSEEDVGLEVSPVADARSIGLSIEEFFQRVAACRVATRARCRQVAGERLSFEAIVPIYREIYGT